jgi:hypothetical protein
MQQILTLLKQPNHTIHTSQAATTSRAPTPTADFSGTEESTDSDDNDDRLSWQAVSRSGKRSAGPRATKVPTMKKNKLQQTNIHPTQITITNMYEAVRQAETEGNNKHERKDPASTPIFVAGITNIQRLTAAIEQAANRLNYALIIINSDAIKVMAKNSDYHKIITDILKEKKDEFHTYQPRQQRAYRVLIRNLHHSMQQKSVREEIESSEHKIRNLWNIRRRVTGYHLPLFFLDIELPANNIERYHIDYLQNMRVQTEPPHQKQNNIPQCKTCHAYSIQRCTAHTD